MRLRYARQIGAGAHGVRLTGRRRFQTAGCQNNRIRNVGFLLAGGQVARNDTSERPSETMSSTIFGGESTR